MKNLLISDVANWDSLLIRELEKHDEGIVA
jgi:hypothetical protein